MATRGAILLLLAAALPAATAKAATTGGLPAPTERIQRSLTALEAGDCDLAQREAMRLAADGQDDSARAWVIAAAALQRQGQFAQAAEAYRRYLPSCDDPAQQRYVRDQIACCQAAINPPAPNVPPSAQLSETELRELAVVSDQTFVETSEHFTVRARNGTLAKLVARQAESALTRICRTVLAGGDYPHDVDVDVYVWTDTKEFSRNAVSAPEWAGGSSFAGLDAEGRSSRRIDLTQLDERGRFDAVLLDRVLPHETAHLVVADFFGDTRCPLAVSEGLAMLNEETVDNGRVLLAGAAVGGDRGLPLAKLLTIEHCTRENAAVVYAESYSLMRYLQARLSADQFKDVLNEMRNGLPLDEAIQRALCVPPDENFLERLAQAWAAEAVCQAHFLQALR